ncbi:sensor histidine kinase [Bacteroidota bacterium]
MKEPFFTLTPERVRFDRFWVEIRQRNIWLILLRYGAVGMLLSLILGIVLLKYIYGVDEYQDIIPLWIITGSIFIYNLLFHKYWHYDREKRIRIYKIHGLRFSFLQICIDFVALMLFIYFTGGIETPIYSFFIFHVIIGSLFLPGRVIYLIITMTLLITSGGALLEYYQLIPHYHISGWIDVGLHQNHLYLLVYFLFYGIMLYLSIYLANSIARKLYQRERDLTIAYNELEGAEKTKSRYVRSVVHDLKTPIAAANTYLNMILDNTLGEVKEELKHPLERSKYRLDRAIDTINKILQISELKLSSEPKALIDVNVKDIFEDIYNDMSILIKTKKLDYELKCESEEDIIVQADSDLLKIAFSNLITNSYKYTRGGGRIDVKLETDNKNVVITVSDNGIGIPKEAQDKIFNEFYRTPLSRKEGVDGTGLGMSIVKQIIEKYHGNIVVKSPSYLAGDMGNPGSEFRITLPRFYREI